MLMEIDVENVQYSLIVSHKSNSFLFVKICYLHADYIVYIPVLFSRSFDLLLKKAIIYMFAFHCLKEIFNTDIWFIWNHLSSHFNS